MNLLNLTSSKSFVKYSTLQQEFKTSWFADLLLVVFTAELMLGTRTKLCDLVKSDPTV